MAISCQLVCQGQTLTARPTRSGECWLDWILLKYTGFFLFITGSFINWPTLLLAPVLVYPYFWLATAEEEEALERFGEE